MAQGITPQQDAGVDGGVSITRLLALLTESLAMVDALGLPGHVGARLQHVIDDVDHAASAPPEPGEDNLPS